MLLWWDVYYVDVNMDDFFELSIEIFGVGVVKCVIMFVDGCDFIYYDDFGIFFGVECVVDVCVFDLCFDIVIMCLDVLMGDWIMVVVNWQNWVMMFGVDVDLLVLQILGNLFEVFLCYDVVVFENWFFVFGFVFVEVVGLVLWVDDVFQGFDDLVMFDFGCICIVVGCCEVVCFSLEYFGLFGIQFVIWVCIVIEVWVDCMVMFLCLFGIEQVFLFENCGEVIGVILLYLYGQIYVYFYVILCMIWLQELIVCIFFDLFVCILELEQVLEWVVFQGEYWMVFVLFVV